MLAGIIGDGAVVVKGHAGLAAIDEVVLDDARIAAADAVVIEASPDQAGTDRGILSRNNSTVAVEDRALLDHAPLSHRHSGTGVAGRVRDRAAADAGAIPAEDSTAEGAGCA